MELAAPKPAERFLGYVWLCALGVALVIAAVTADRHVRQVEEYACFCDPFGYLQMAQETREAVSAGRLPQFTIESDHTRLLIDLMKSRDIPLPYWDEMIAPLCFHYFPSSNHVGVTYPPGAGLILALFPKGKALLGLNRLVIVIFVATGLAMLVGAGIRRAWLSAGFLILALDLGLEILGQIDNASFSINAILAPMLLSSLCLSAAFVLRADNLPSLYSAWLLTFLAGLLFGYAILARLPVALLMGGILVLLWPVKVRAWYKSALAPFLMGVTIGGVLPVFVHQSRLAGAWNLPTYGRGNAGPPTLASLWPNLPFYFGPGKPSAYNWAPLVMVVGCLGLLLWTIRHVSAERSSGFFPGLSWKRLGLAALFMWILPTIYFLTHYVAIHYYPVPATFGTVLLLAWGAFNLENYKVAAGANSGPLRRVLRLVGLTLALAPGLIVIERVWSNYVPLTVEATPRQVTLPAELADERAWIWAFELSGTLWYYAHKPAHKINFSDPDTRLLVYEFVFNRGEPQYILQDSSEMQRMQKEIVELGGTLEDRGEVAGHSYFLIRWPAGGPKRRVALFGSQAGEGRN